MAVTFLRNELEKLLRISLSPVSAPNQVLVAEMKTFYFISPKPKLILHKVGPGYTLHNSREASTMYALPAAAG